MISNNKSFELVVRLLFKVHLIASCFTLVDTEDLKLPFLEAGKSEKNKQLPRCHNGVGWGGGAGGVGVW